MALISAMFVAQQLSRPWYGDVTHLRRALGFSLRDIADGQWWRVLTPNLTNGPIPPDFGPPGLTHLLANIAGLLAVGPFIERQFGRVRFVALVVATGALAWGWIVLPATITTYGDGTSGVVYGLFGAFAVLVVAHPPRSRWARLAVACIALGALRGVVNRPVITQEVHAGGFAAGVLLGAIFVRTRTALVGVMAAAGTVAALLVVLAVRMPQLSKTDPRLVSTTRVGSFPAAVAVADGGPIVSVAEPPLVVAPGRWRSAVDVNPGAVLPVGDSVWVTSIDTGTVTRLSAEGRVTARIRLGPRPFGLAYDGRDVWVTSTAASGRVWRVDPQLARVTGHVDTGAAGYAATWAGGAVWVADGHHPSVVRIDRSTMIARRVHVGCASSAISAVSDTRVWAGCDGRIAEIDAYGAQLLRRFLLPRSFVADIAVAPDGRVWVSDGRGHRLLALDAMSRRVVDRVSLGLIQPTDLAVDGTHVWAADYWGGRLLRVDV